MNKSNKVYVATRQEIELGNAKILSNIDGELKEYNIEIQKTYLNNNYDNKSMLIKVTDKDLLEKTGGIIQRNEWFTNNSKWKVYWSCNTCTC